MARKTFKQFNEMSMSVTLKPKKNNMYKVTGVGSKMKKHGGIKKGEKFSSKNICVKRPGNGISPMQWEKVIGNKAKKKFEKDELIKL